VRELSITNDWRILSGKYDVQDEVTESTNPGDNSVSYTQLADKLPAELNSSFNIYILCSANRRSCGEQVC